jgi:hypothetical protein
MGRLGSSLFTCQHHFLAMCAFKLKYLVLNIFPKDKEYKINAACVWNVLQPSRSLLVQSFPEDPCSPNVLPCFLPNRGVT